MRKTLIKKIGNKEKKSWLKEKEKEWRKNANFWIKIIRQNLDPYRAKVTNRAVLEIFKKEGKMKILDAGCGEGYLCRLLAKQGHKLTGIDFCPDLIEAAQKLEKEKPLGIKYLSGDFRATNLPAGSFNAIVSHQTIHEINNPQKAFQEFKRLLKKKGRLVLLFIHPCFDVEPEKYFAKVKIKKSYYLVSGIKSPSSYFYLHLPLSQWTAYLKKGGFTIKKIEEPQPSKNLFRKNKWWKENFKKPLFILIEAVKN